MKLCLTFILIALSLAILPGQLQNDNYLHIDEPEYLWICVTLPSKSLHRSSVTVCIVVVVYYSSSLNSTWHQ